jgi:hypothetical protein
MKKRSHQQSAVSQNLFTAKDAEDAKENGVSADWRGREGKNLTADNTNEEAAAVNTQLSAKTLSSVSSPVVS